VTTECASSSRSAIAASLAVLLLLALPGSAFEETYSEYQVKAAFLVNFARFVDWPAQAFQNAGDPLLICIWEPDPFGGSMDAAVLRQTAGGRPLEARRISSGKEVTDCRVLYIRALNLHVGRSVVGERYVLVVSEKGSDISGESAINFIREHGRIHFEIDVAAAAQAGLKIRAPLLSLATTVKR
jgi:hypothetical protein